ncbi:MAG TPA: DNA polymerase [Anaerolineae bacterium]|nr:DNA polymerase [Anaerolineae bacterium]
MRIIPEKPEPDVSKLAYTHRPVFRVEPIEEKLVPLKVVLVNTALKVETLCRKMDKYEGWIGFDTEVTGPLLRGRDFVNISYSSLLGLSLAFEDGKAYYIPFRHKGNNASFMDLHEICTRLQTRTKLWAHNAKFDHQVMIRAGYPLHNLLDSMIAAWLVTGKNKGIGLKDLALEVLGRKSPEYDPSISHKTGDAVKVYAGHDALNTLQLGLHYWHQMSESDRAWLHEECKFTRLLAEMKLAGMNLDKGQLRGLRYQATKELDGVHKRWKALAPEVSITSSKQLQQLFEEGIWVPHGVTAGGQFSTSGSAMEWNVKNARGDGKELAKLRLEYQETSKVVTTYTDGLIEEALQWADKKLHPDLFHFGTVTGRLASANPNIQNQPAHGVWAQRVRACFIPDPGMEFTSADYSQVELRYFAEYCGGSILQAFMEGADLHQRTADAMGISRDLAKMVNFGFLLYGGGPDKLAGELGCSKKEAEEKIAALHAEYPEVEKFRQHVIEVVTGRGPLPWCKTRAGRIRHIPELNQDYMRAHYPEEYKVLANKYRAKCRANGKKATPTGLEWSIRSRGERLVVNYLVQGGSRDLLVLGMNQYQMHPDKTLDMTLVTTVHDEVLTQNQIGDGEQARQVLKESLESAGPLLGLKVPIIAEPKTGSNWSEIK